MLLTYRDHCTISRPSLDRDEWGGENVTLIYDGVCDFQPGGQTSLSIVTHNDVVYLPRAVMVKSNDIIEVEPLIGSKRKGVVNIPKNLGLELDGSWVTEIEIKQAVEQ